MTTHSPDVTYAYARLGLDFGAPLEEIEQVLTHARAYRFSTRTRIEDVERFVAYFEARDQLGDIHTPFTFIRRAYHKKAMMLHPDRNSGNKEAEEQLKLINAAFGIVEAMHREARDYYRQNENIRTETEEEARAAIEREMPPEIRAKRKAKKEKTEHASYAEARQERESAYEARWASPTRPEIKFVAASIPRFIRTARLGHIPLDCVISCWHLVQRDGSHFVYDIIMLPEREFLRARMHLSTPHIMNPALQRGGFTPNYIPKDIKVFTVPPGDPYPERVAREHFLKEFGLEGKSGI